MSTDDFTHSEDHEDPTNGNVLSFSSSRTRSSSGNRTNRRNAAADLSPERLLDELDSERSEMAERAYEVLVAALPETGDWSETKHAEYVEQSKERFSAILAVSARGEEVDGDSLGELREVGAGAAGSGIPLPALLATLRMSRDVVVQTAMKLSTESAGITAALSLVMTRILPATDQISDAIAQGYWGAVLTGAHPSH